jgi:hypothetical protein
MANFNGNGGNRSRRVKTLLIAVVAFAWLCAAQSLIRADDKKPAEKPPKVLVAMPLGVSPGIKTRLVLRGVHLDETTAIEATAAGEPVDAHVIDKKKATLPPNQTPETSGDTQVEIELTLPANKSPDCIRLIVTCGKGKTEPYEIPVTTADLVVVDQEPNDGFTHCQPLTAGKTVVGAIHEAKNVDVFGFAGKTGDTVSFAVAARKHGSRLDALLWLHDVRGNLLASADDDDNSVDPHLKLKLPSDGKYFLTLLDANDLGDATYGYRLSFTSTAAAK